MISLPKHLQKYIVQQNYERYTPVDQAVWRYCLRQLRKFLSKNAHDSYLSGLEKTGIDVESIPRIEDISQKLEAFGWRALPVSGFIPPAAFMELQSLSVLPIASDMRSIEHLQYTPAPDIVHEAAGHAPIIAHPEYAEYLKQYSQVAKKSIISQEDLDLYEAIRWLSDIKENPASTKSDIAQAESKLNSAINNITHVSEASQLSRMNWWTAEYGLIGSLENPKIFGAGLLSSVGESKWCLSPKVKKIPLTVDCIKQSYDITEPQPQLFVTPDFKTLFKVLEDFAQTMAFKLGGTAGLDKAIQSKTVNTVELDSGLQCSGQVEKYLTKNNKIIFIKLSGPSQIAFKDDQIHGQDKNYHQHGYSSPLGTFIMSQNQGVTELKYESGFTVTGELIKTETLSSAAQVMTFKNATAQYQNEIYFEPSWGLYDIITGQTVTSVFGGPADRKAYGETTDFIAARVPQANYSVEQQEIFKAFALVREFRHSTTKTLQTFKTLIDLAQTSFPNQWLLWLELFEIASTHKWSAEMYILQNHLNQLGQKNSQLKEMIQEGMTIAHE